MVMVDVFETARDALRKRLDHALSASALFELWGDGTIAPKVIHDDVIPTVPNYVQIWPMPQNCSSKPNASGYNSLQTWTMPVRVYIVNSDRKLAYASMSRIAQTIAAIANADPSLDGSVHKITATIMEPDVGFDDQKLAYAACIVEFECVTRIDGCELKRLLFND